MLQKTMGCFVLLAWASCATIPMTFDLWMSHTGVDTLCLVVNFIDNDGEPRHITIDNFEASDIVGVALAVIVKMLLSDFHLTDKIISYVKGEDNSLKTMASALTLVVSCKPLALLPWECVLHTLCSKHVNILSVHRSGTCLSRT